MPPPLSLYVHLPWCARKCPYCDFNSHTQPDTLPEAAYIDALLSDLTASLPSIWGRTVSSVFFGGGTPSLFSAESLDRLLSGIRAQLNLLPTCEITLESNPGSSEYQKFADFRALGINRLSLGIQSFSDVSLQRLGRVHDATQAGAAVEMAQRAGFNSLNIDLMYALPGQSIADMLADLDRALSYEPTHLSHYQLTLEPNTAFHHNPPANLPDADGIWQMQTCALERLQAYQHYEVSAYAKAGHRCVHNLNYWRYGDYLGIGAGAHSKLTDVARACIQRTIKHRQPADYMRRTEAGEPALSQRVVAVEESGLEFMLNAMRLTEGVPSALFLAHTGVPLGRFESALQAAEQAGLLYRDHLTLCPTARGHLFLNDLLEYFA